MLADGLGENQHVWEYHGSDSIPEFNLKGKLWLIVLFFLVSFLCIGYVFIAVIEKEKEERKNK